MPSADTVDADTAGAAEAEARPPTSAAEAPDLLRQRLVDVLRAELGDAVVGVVLQPGRDLWVRVRAEAWVQAGEAARDRLGLHLLLLPVGDRLAALAVRAVDGRRGRPGRSAGEPGREPEPMTHGCTGGDSRFQVFARLHSVEHRWG